MIKRIDKLILTSFLGPFILTFLVVVFILLMQHMLKYFDDIIGKDLGWGVLGSLLFYFAIFMTPVALPLGVLLSSLITFGNLGEHFELTAVKSLGISLVRSLGAIFVFVMLLTVLAFYANNTLVPKAALEAYSLLYDIKQKKPALDLREGAFLSSIPDVSIKVNDKLPDGIGLRGVIIYDHRGKTGNKEVTIADSGRMYTILNDQYLKLELFRGYNYSEGSSTDKDMMGRQPTNETMSKTKFDKTQIVFDLSSFGLMRTDKKWFQGNRIMRNLPELESDLDSIDRELKVQKLGVYTYERGMFRFHAKDDTLEVPADLKALKAIRDSTAKAKALAGGSPGGTVQDPQPFPSVKAGTMKKGDSLWVRTKKVSDSLFSIPYTTSDFAGALGHARMVKSQLMNFNTQLKNDGEAYRIFEIQWHKILAQSFACMVMFLIGAPLGAIIKKGGLGVPVLVSILFFIIWYLLSMTGEKWARQGEVNVAMGVWGGDLILLVVGLLFLRQARVDARLFDSDFYNVMWDKFKKWLMKRGIMKGQPA